MSGTPCDENGNDLPPGTPPLPPPLPPLDEDGEWLPFYPYSSHQEFELAYFLFKQNQMPASQIDDLMQIWARIPSADEDPPFADHGDLYDTIDATTVSDAPWHSFSITYTGECPEGEVPPWMDAEYDVWYWDPHMVLQNQLANPDFRCEFDYAPYQRFNNGQ